MKFTELKELLKIYTHRHINGRREPVPLLDDYINSVAKDYFQHTKKAAGSMAITTVSGTESYTLTTVIETSTVPIKTYFAVDSLVYNGDDITIYKANIKDLETTPYHTDKQYWFIYNGNIYFHPAPDGAYTATVYGRYFPTYGQGDQPIGDASDGMTIKLGCQAMLENDFGDLNRGAHLRQQYETEKRLASRGYIETQDNSYRLYDL